jgi:butirosin biosynthesis protein H-like
MTVLPNYHHFDGLGYEIGAIRNILAYQGIPAPHTGQPLSNSLLLGVSGGIAVGYFLFEYKGYLPHIALLTRNTFDPLETLFERLAIPREVLQTSKPETALKNLMNVLESGHPALVWVRYVQPALQAAACSRPDVGHDARCCIWRRRGHRVHR